MRLGLSADELLTTTRSVRRRLDLERPVSASVIEDAIAIAVQAPTGGNLQNWVWIAIQDRDTKRDIAELYRNFYALYREVLRDTPNGGPGRDQQLISSGDILAANLDRVPWLVIPCISPLGGRVDRETEAFAQAMTWASIFPAVWSLQLALRERGLASCLTTNHLAFERDVADILGIPYETTNQAAMLPVAYSKGTRFRPAARRFSEEGLLRFDHWTDTTPGRG